MESNGNKQETQVVVADAGESKSDFCPICGKTYQIAGHASCFDGCGYRATSGTEC